MKKIILITGGQRSGKSQYAESMALSLSDNPVYIATAHVWDEEFKERVEKHQQRRGPQWEHIEEQRNLGSIYISNKVALIDCLTLWATNFFFAGVITYIFITGYFNIFALKPTFSSDFITNFKFTDKHVTRPLV